MCLPSNCLYIIHRDYAESIEAQLKSFNMMVDLLFPPPDILPSQVLTDLSQRRCLYAIFVTAENESHHSLTLNILHGSPQGMVQSVGREICPVNISLSFSLSLSPSTLLGTPVVVQLGNSILILHD